MHCQVTDGQNLLWGFSRPWSLCYWDWRLHGTGCVLEVLDVAAPLEFTFQAIECAEGVITDVAHDHGDSDDHDGDKGH